MLIVDGTLVPTRDHSVAEQSKNYRYSTNRQVVVDAGSRLVVLVGEPLPGNRNDCKAWVWSPEYTSRDFSVLAAELGVRLSVGRTGQCWDNALSESL